MGDPCPKCGGSKMSPASVQVALIFGATMLQGGYVGAEWVAPIIVTCMHQTHDKPGFDRITYHPNR